MVFGDKPYAALIHKRAKEERTANYAIARYPSTVGKLAVSKVHMTRVGASPLTHADAITGIPLSAYDEASGSIRDILINHGVIESESTRTKNDALVGLNVVGFSILLSLHSDHTTCFRMHDKTFGRCLIENLGRQIFHSLLKGGKEARAVFCPGERTFQIIGQAFDPVTVGHRLAVPDVIQIELIARA